MPTPHPGQDKYPDLKTPIEEHDISKGVHAEVKDGWVYFTNAFDENVAISEWDFGNFVTTWLVARSNQHSAWERANSER